jgi:hypothetical protein
LLNAGLETGQTLHMVERKPQVQAQNTQSAPPTAAPPNTATQQRNFVAFPNMVMGTISIPNDGTPPPINQIIGSLLNTINGGAVPNAPQPTTNGSMPPSVTNTPPGMVSNIPAPDRHAHVRQFLTTLDQQLTQLGVTPVNPQDTANDTHLLDRVSATLTRVSQALTRRGEVTQNNGEKIRQLQHIVHQLGIMLTLVSPNMGTLIDPNYVPPASNNTNVTPHMQVFQISSNNAEPGTENAAQNTAQNTMHMNIPLITIRRQGNVPPSGTAPNTAAPNTNANPIFQMMNSMMQSFVPAQNTAVDTTNTVAAQNTAAVPAPSATLNMMNNPTGAMLNQMFSAVNQLMTTPQQNTTLSAAVSAMSPAVTFDSSDAVSWLMQAVMDNMTVPDLLALMAGQWGCWDRIQPLIRQRWLAEQLPRLNTTGHVTDAQNKFAEQLLKSFEVQVRNTVLPSDLMQQLPNNAHVAITMSALTPHIKSLVQWCVAEGGVERGATLRTLIHAALVQWVRALSAELDAGVESAALVVRHIVTALVHMDQLPAELMTMSSTMITDYVLRVYTAHTGSSVPSVVNNNINNAEPLPAIPGVPTDWNDVVARDVKRQEKQREQDPFSDAYAADHPHPNKKRKVGNNSFHLTIT